MSAVDTSSKIIEEVISSTAHVLLLEGFQIISASGYYPAPVLLCFQEIQIVKV
jgi:hypothetical protein